MMLADKEYLVLAGVYLAEEYTALNDLQHTFLKPIMLDVTSENSVADFFEYLREHPHCKLVALINNAGISINLPLEITKIDVLEKQFAVNTFGMLRVTQKAIPHLEDKEY